MAETATVGTIQLLDALNAVHRLGVPLAPLRAAIGVRADVLRDPDGRVSTAAVARLFVEAERLTGDPFVGLHAGERAEARGTLAYLVLATSSLGQGMRHVARFSPLAIDTLRLRVEQHGSTASTVIDPGDRTFEECHHAVDYLLMLNVRAIRRAIGEYRLHEVHVRHGARGAAKALATAFGCPVRIKQPDNRLVYPLTVLRAASRFANPRIADQIAKLATASLGQVVPPNTVRERVASAARALIAAGLRAQSATVARRLGLSGRSLQRGLSAEGTSFRQVRDAVLWETVEVLLSSPDLKIEAVALSVGFADVAAFSKAFKRWAGCPPAQYRSRLAVVARP
jgi:AraC-like DNA-binding protein